GGPVLCSEILPTNSAGDPLFVEATGACSLSRVRLFDLFSFPSVRSAARLRIPCTEGHAPLSRPSGGGEWASRFRLPSLTAPAAAPTSRPTLRPNIPQTPSEPPAA